jgi:hypothetical protein
LVGVGALQARFLSGFPVIVLQLKARRIKGSVTFVTVLSFTLLRHFRISWRRLDAFLVVAPCLVAVRELPQAERNGL